MGQVTVGVVGTSRKPDEHHVTVLTHRSVSASRRRWHPARLVHYARDPERPSRTLALDSSARGSVAEFLAQHDIVVDCILQDTDDALMFVMSDELELFEPGSLFIDVSCDEGMGFEWASPTSFADPTSTVGPGARGPLLRGRPHAVAPVELRHVGDQRGPHPLPRDAHVRPRGMGRRPDDPSGHRDPRRAVGSRTGNWASAPLLVDGGSSTLPRASRAEQALLALGPTRRHHRLRLMDMPSAHATVLQELRRKLDTELAELTAPIERGASIQFGKRVGDGTAEAQALLTSNARIAQLLAHREQVDQALAKVEAGTYGHCDGCDMAIPPARLALRPESTHCVQCASARRSH